jgi:2-C-methyl-D-erythritol 2,4-cyclodiphosphate synthase
MDYPRTLVGQGYDAHRFDEERALILGGVPLPGPGLAGHSDADVLIHAVCDALLGAVGAGDIGEHFPDSDPAYAGISSLKLLERVVEVLHERHAKPLHIDVTVIAEQPRLGPHKGAIRLSLQRFLGGASVNIKATSTEGMGFTGRGEGIAAMAVATVLQEREFEQSKKE